jgi:predicted nucleic-acid-binding Zn-ribbon protein
MSIEAMKQALEQIVNSAEFKIGNPAFEQKEAVLRQAIKKAEKQEPVAYTVNVKCQRCGSAETYDLTIDAAHGIKENT